MAGAVVGCQGIRHERIRLINFDPVSFETGQDILNC